MFEAKNSEKCLDNFRKLSPHIADYVYVPKVYWNLSTSKLLTMEFMDGAQVDDVKTIQRLGIQPNEVAKLVSSWVLYGINSIWLEIVEVGLSNTQNGLHLSHRDVVERPKPQSRNSLSTSCTLCRLVKLLLR